MASGRFMASGRLRARLLPSLLLDDSYKLHGVEETHREVGVGSRGVVTVVRYKGMKCAAKKVYPVLEFYDPGNHFVRECMLCLQLRHPHIVQSLGYYHNIAQHQGPALVMELLSTDLSRCINRYGVLPKEISFSILHDIALGLQYLHVRSKPIIHRNLIATSIFLTDNMTAKIGSFGSAVVPTPSEALHQHRLTIPSVHLPPEARAESFPGEYTNVKVDIFSYGVLMVHILSGQKPSDLYAYKLTVSEADRYWKYLQVIDSEHPLMGLILRCLKNHPADRPAAREIVNNTLFPCDKLWLHDKIWEWPERD